MFAEIHTFFTTNWLGMAIVMLAQCLAVTVPLLVGIGDVIGIMGGFLVATGQLGFNKTTYIQTTLDFLESADVISSLAKGAVFGFIATLTGCYHGMASGRGAMGVGGATKTAVAAASILILAANFLLTSVMFTP